MKTETAIFDGVKFVFVPADEGCEPPNHLDRLFVEWTSPTGEKFTISVFSWVPGTGHVS